MTRLKGSAAEKQEGNARLCRWSINWGVMAATATPISKITKKEEGENIGRKLRWGDVGRSNREEKARRKDEKRPGISAEAELAEGGVVSAGVFTLEQEIKQDKSRRTAMLRVPQTEDQPRRL